MKKTNITIISIISLASAVSAQTYDDLLWIPSTQGVSGATHGGFQKATNHNGGIFNEPNGGYVMTITGDTLYINDPSTHNIRWEGAVINGSNGPQGGTSGQVTLTFAQEIDYFALELFAGAGTLEALNFSLPADQIVTVGSDRLPTQTNSTNHVLFNGNTSARRTATSAGGTSFAIWNNLPNGTDSITLTPSLSSSGSRRAGFSSIEYSFAPVPEPSSAALLGLGALGLMARRKR